MPDQLVNQPTPEPVSPGLRPVPPAQPTPTATPAVPVAPVAPEAPAPIPSLDQIVAGRRAEVSSNSESAAVAPAPAPAEADASEDIDQSDDRIDQPDEQLESEDQETGDELDDEDYEPENPLASEAISWQASEYVHHHKGPGWYAVLALVMGLLLIAALIYKLWLSIGVFIAMGVAIAVYAYKPPRILSYQLDATSITIEGKSYPFESFRSFGVLSDESWHTIDLEPVKRLMPRLNVLFADEDFDNIVAHLEAHLPRADRQPDMVERLTRYLRF